MRGTYTETVGRVGPTLQPNVASWHMEMDATYSDDDDFSIDGWAGPTIAAPRQLVSIRTGRSH